MPRPKATQEEQGNAMFIGSLYSTAELEFLIEHLGEPPEVAIPELEEGEEGTSLPLGVNPAAVRPILDHTYRLDLLAHKVKNPTFWVGFDRIRDICRRTLEWNESVAELKRRTKGAGPKIRLAAASPSLHMWDPDTDIPYLGGIGADADFVRTAIDEQGKRVPLFTLLRETGVGAIKDLRGVAAMIKKGANPPKDLLDGPNALDYNHGETTSTVGCPVCGHTEVYESSKPSDKRAAERRMQKHLKTARVKKDAHQLLGKRLQSGMAGRGSAAAVSADTGEVEGAAN